MTGRTQWTRGIGEATLSTLEVAMKYCHDNRAVLRVDYATPGVVNVCLWSRGRLGNADGPTFEDAFEIARMKYEAGWK